MRYFLKPQTQRRSRVALGRRWRQPVQNSVISDDILILSGSEISDLLEGHDNEIVEVVTQTYIKHAVAQTTVPHSSFLALPDAGNRIIALPAYIGGDEPTAGIKWISSMPQNVNRGVDRASAVIVLNDLDTGRPYVVLEGSLISATRTAASALVFMNLVDRNIERLAIVGCGPINFHIARLANRLCSSLKEFFVFDLDSARAKAFAGRLEAIDGVKSAREASSLASACRSCQAVSFATTAVRPYIEDLPTFSRAPIILHISLRDIAPSIILAADNVVDDRDHVCRADTSIHLAEKHSGGRGFIRCSLGDILIGHAPPRVASDRPVIFSPFGLGILDVAVATFVANKARQVGKGVRIAGFFGHPVAGTRSGSPRRVEIPASII